MPGLRQLSGRQVRAILEANGFTYVFQKGSHIKLRKTDEDGTVRSAIIPDHHALKIGTLSSIIRQSGLSRSLFEA